MSSDDQGDYRVVEVLNRKNLGIFLQLPRAIYQDPLLPYVQPLNSHVRMMLGKWPQPGKHLLLVYWREQPVARIAFKPHQHGDEKYLHFGFYECAHGHPEATRRLFSHARSLYPQLTMRGPFHFRMEDPYIGILVSGFEKAPGFLMSYNLPHYDEYLQQAGCSSLMDLQTYEIKVCGAPPRVVEMAKRGHANGITIRWLNSKNLKKEVDTIVRIFNDALSENWGFEEFVDAQVEEMLALFKFFIDPRLVVFAQKDGQDVGCTIMLPDLNTELKKARGRITPRLLWTLLTHRRRTPKKIRGYAVGVLKRCHGMGVAGRIAEEMFARCTELGVEYCEISWVLSNNKAMNELSIAIDGKPDKIYRIYEYKQSP